MEIILKQKKGITLIAIVITIIVLLILAGISISMLSGDNSILQRATNAKTNTENANEEEQIKLAVLGSYGDNGKLEIETINSNIKNKINGVTTDDATEFPLTVTYTATGNNYTISSDGIVEKANIYPTVGNTLKAGDYVEYNNKPYVVLYDMDSEFGWVEIVSVNPLESVTLGKNDSTTGAQGVSGELDRAIWSYNNAISNLNTIAQKYLDNDLADRARCIGSDPTNPLNEEGNSSIKGIDNNSNKDFNQLKSIGANNINDTNYSFYWLSSRDKIFYVNESEDFYLNPELGLERINSSGKKSNMMNGTLGKLIQIYYENQLYYDEQDGGCNGYEATAGFRPVIRLISIAKVISGDGSSDSPYKLQK